MATLLEPAEPEIRAVADHAREVLAGLSDRPFLDRLEAGLILP